MRYIIVILTSILLLIGSHSIAQQGDAQLAYQYYSRKDYSKAAELFLQLYERTHSSQYLDYYIISLINNKDYDKAEESLTKYLKANANNKDYLINLGYIYTQQGKQRKAEDAYRKAIDKLLPNNNDISNTANRFRNVREYEWANRTYLKGRSLLKNPKAYTIEIGDNYMYDRNYDEMLQIYFDYLKDNPNNLNVISGKLNTARYYDVNNSLDSIVWRHLNTVISQENYAPVFDELAVNMAIQRGDFKSAYNFAEKLASKVSGKQNVFMNLAREARRSGQYDIAVNAYNKVIAVGKEQNPLYQVASKEILFSKYEKYEQEKTPIESYSRLTADDEQYLNEYGYVNSNIDAIILLSDIYTYKLDSVNKADSILQKGITIPRLNAAQINTLKTKRADILAFGDNLWEATILYTQIEKSNPNNDIGYSAKLKKAWMAYYDGDLMWANAQFSVLKGATTKLISNDAIRISHFIGMNYVPEEDNSALENLAKCEYLIFKRKYDQALSALDSVIQDAPSASISDYAQLRKVEVLLKQFQTAKAIDMLTALKDRSSEVYIRAEAIYKLAEFEKNADKKDEAKELYRTLITDYSGSVYSVEAAQLYRNLEK
ncbi:MAG: tetratricopeptide repeat protein [Culturomica sp.]|jgi:tetratricopeptide (TPR) repeat protein|nr:tetratricopeptide repeat protein [Culturomica sp.]